MANGNAKDTKWAAIKTGSGKITGYLEMFRVGGKYVSVPGVSRFRVAAEAK